MKKWNCNFAIPFSSLHSYSRQDSKNMNKFVTPLKEHFNGFDNKFGTILPAFITWDTETENYNEINPNKNDEKYQTPEDFGDNWNDNLDKNDMLQIERYFKKFYQIKLKIFCHLKLVAQNSILNFQIKMRVYNFKPQEIHLFFQLITIYLMMF